MISKSLQNTFEMWQAEGLVIDVTKHLQDIIYLNALALKAHNSNELCLAQIPRCAFLGDLVLWEPSIGTSIWLTKAGQMLDASIITQRALIIYALSRKQEDLIELNNLKLLEEQLLETVNSIKSFTPNQIAAAIDYVMYGNDWRRNEEYKEIIEDNEIDEVLDVPSAILSEAQLLLNKAIGVGIDKVSAESLRSNQLHRLIINKAIEKGEAFANEKTDNLANYNLALDAFHEKLILEKRQVI